jgi:inorganic pyrophosphatase
MVDRFLHTAMFYPGNYGFIPQTLSEDGDPCDVLVVSQVQVVPGAIIRCRPVGALVMEDEAGGDEKIIAVPVDALAPFYRNVRSFRDLPPTMCEQIAHFFQHYKDLEKGKWVTIVKWLDVKGAEKLVLDAMARAALASEASGQRSDSMVHAHSASKDARKRADDTRPEPGSSARPGHRISEIRNSSGRRGRDRRRDRQGRPTIHRPRKRPSAH